MDRATTIFRAFFKSTYEYVKFKRTYRVLTGRTLPHNYFKDEATYTLVVLDRYHQTCSFDDKPSVIVVDLMSADVMILWQGKEKDRIGKPALVCINSDSGFYFQWWKDGKKRRHKYFDPSWLTEEEAEAKLLQAEKYVGEIRELLRLVAKLGLRISSLSSPKRFLSKTIEWAEPDKSYVYEESQPTGVVRPTTGKAK